MNLKYPFIKEKMLLFYFGTCLLILREQENDAFFFISDSEWEHRKISKWIESYFG